MVNTKQTKRKRDIKTKLMAAICMLLVSSIMMVSTTYAWFTLSTAPEVTGINTAVGANGNLEMALLPANAATAGADFGITSSAGDSVLGTAERNVTWGNLVQLSTEKEGEIYGLDKIKLYPAKLNEAGGMLADAMLQTPAYGADGRVSELKSDTVTSIYNSTAENFPQAEGYGVRAVGTASGMTDRQLAYRNARSSANTSMAMAKTQSSQSLNTNGASLANIAISHAANSGTDADVYTEADVANLLAIVYDLLGKDGKTGVLEHIEDAYRNYIIALGASAANAPTNENPDNGMTDDEFKLFQSAVNSADTLTDAMNQLTENGITLPAEISGPVAMLATTRTNVETAKGELEALSGDSIPWNSLSTPLNRLADTGAMKINGYPASDFRNNMSDIINGVANGGLVVSIATGGGVYADVADHCGNFTASITIEKVEYGGMTLNNMNARMATETTVTPVYLSRVGSAVELAGAPSGVGGQVMPISDFYGYIIDLAFRTNAAESNLLLQSDATDRIYSENGADAETMGHGSTMTFTSTTTDFTVAQLKALMGAIRVVFFNPMDSNKVLGTAKLDLTEGNYTTTGGNSITAKLYLYKEVAATTTVTYEPITGDEVGTHIADDTAEGGYRAIISGETGTHKEVTNTTAAHEEKLTGGDAVITALTQNTATAVSALVYLDGENVGNDDVAATDATSMTGTMNLQFASSANLVPMNYTPLMTQGTSTDATEAPTEAPTT